MLEIHTHMCKIRVEVHISEALEQKRRGIVKKKKILTEVFVLFFIAAVFMAVYVVIEMGNDWLAVLGGAAVLLISAYLLMDYWMESKPEHQNAEESEAVSRRFDEMEEVQKAIYTVIKRGNAENAELLQKMDSRLAEMTQTLERMCDAVASAGAGAEEAQKAVLDAVKGMRQDYQTGVKNLIKYEKENAKQIAETAHTNTEMTIMEIGSQLTKIQNSLQDQQEQLAFMRLSSMSVPYSMSGSDSEEDLLPVLEDAVMPTEETDSFREGAAPEEEDAEAFDAEAAIKAYMMEQGYVDIEEPEEAAEVLPEPEAEPEPEVPHQKTEEEIANTLQSMATGDPNRALTPEEIAAMFAAVQ